RFDAGEANPNGSTATGSDNRTSLYQPAGSRQLPSAAVTGWRTRTTRSTATPNGPRLVVIR
ncbi:MAG: hypothetical protein VYA32_09295, partial [Planctomycetota bacterium]|nr:hypothetical protein [Planctomycetota bacterium]